VRGHALVSGAARITDGVDISDAKVMQGTVNPDVLVRLSVERIGDKYALTNDTLEYEGHTLRRIKALKSFGDVRAGEIGGYIESPNNLSADGGCWVSHSAMVMDNARVMDNVLVRNDAIVKDNAQIGDNALIGEGTNIFV
jgi:phage related protein